MTAQATIVAPAAARAAASSERIAWLDVARGIGIILVVIGHALGGLIDSPIGAHLTAIRYAFIVIYIFHMPLFFILSGLMTARRVERNRGRFAASLWTDLIWPYFLWSVIQQTIIFGLGGLANHPVGSLLPTFMLLPVVPISQFWFLYVLCLLHGLALLGLQTLGRSRFLLACLTLKLVALLVSLPLIPHLVANYAPWYAIGVALTTAGLSDRVVARSRFVRMWALPTAAVILIGGYLAAIPWISPVGDLSAASAMMLSGVAQNLAAAPAALCTSAAIVGIAGFASGRAEKILSFLGRRSMPIFILHIMGIVGARIMLVKALGVTNVALILPVIVVAGLSFPLVAFAIAARVGVTRQLGLGRV